MKLSGPVTGSVTTGSSGAYLFSNLPPGDYTVTVQETRPDGTVDRGTVPLKLRAPAFPENRGNTCVQGRKSPGYRGPGP